MPDEPFSKYYFEALLEGIAALDKELPAISRAGEDVADRLVAGGELFIASVRPDFVSEGIVRSGGLMLLRQYGSPADLSEKDTVIVGWSNTTPDLDLKLVRELSGTGARVVGIGPPPPEELASDLLGHTHLLLHSSLPLPTAVTAPFGGECYPLVSLVNLLLLWSLTGEIVAALTRRGHMPAMYQSVLVPGARERNARCSGSRFHRELAVPPVPAGQLGRDFLAGISGIFRSLVEGEVDAIDEVAQVCASVRSEGNAIHGGLISHFPLFQAGAPGDPGHMQRLEPLVGETPSAEELEFKLKRGDLFFFLGYYRRPTAAYRLARHAGALIVEVIAGAQEREEGDLKPDYRIRPRWPFGDSLVSVPGYDVPILPSSGIVQSAIYWAVVGSIRAQCPVGDQR